MLLLLGKGAISSELRQAMHHLVRAICLGKQSCIPLCSVLPVCLLFLFACCCCPVSAVVCVCLCVFSCLQLVPEKEPVIESEVQPLYSSEVQMMRK